MKAIRWSNEVKFKPWVQGPYWNEPVRTLVIGDSHYGQDARAATSEFTSQMVRELAIETPIPFFTRIAAMMNNKILGSESERNSFWRSVAFYNYLQELAGEVAGVPVSYERFADSDAAFREVLRKLKPDLAIVLGHRVWNHMDVCDAAKDKPLRTKGVDDRYLEAWQYATPDGNSTLVFHVKHPSRGFTFGKFHPLYREAVRRVSKTSS
jgi:hypothetical protein